MTISGQPVEHILNKDEWSYYLIPGDPPQLEIICYLRKVLDERASNGSDLWDYDGEKILLSDLPNDLVSADDLESIGITLSQWGPIIQLKVAPRMPSGSLSIVASLT